MSKKVSKAIGSKVSTKVVLSVRNPRQSTLDLVGIVGIKPRINDFMSEAIKRIEREDRESWTRRMRSWSEAMIYDCMGEDDYLLDDDIIYAMCGGNKSLKRLNKKLYKSGGSKKRGKRGGKHSSDISHSARYIGYDGEDDYWKNRRSMYTNGEWEDEMMGDEDYAYEHPGQYKSIKFYSDIENELSCHEFESLKEFNDFCEEHGYKIGDTDLSNLKNWSVIHCCLDPIDLEYGESSIITDSSYGGLYWTVSDDCTKAHSGSVSDVDVRTF